MPYKDRNESLNNKREYYRKNKERMLMEEKIRKERDPEKYRKIHLSANRKYEDKFMHPCCDCGKMVGKTSIFCKGCVRKGERNVNFKKDKGNDYVVLHLKDGKMTSLHRAVFSGHLRRKLLTREIIHHIDECKDNNMIDNLILFRNHSAHARFHAFLTRQGLKGIKFQQLWLR
jgi:hypothetical protein